MFPVIEISILQKTRNFLVRTHRKLLTEMLKQIRLSPLYTLLTLYHPRKQKGVILVKDLC